MERKARTIMHYWIWLNKKGEPKLFQDSLLDFFPKRTIDLMEFNKVPEKVGMCRECHLDTKCHVMLEIDKNTFSKLCPILFVDVVKPPWKLSEIN
ncbi:hypothetical protein KAR91_22755 [Candidatus Pacearchaeota archaeon]|nr:hypothetical protein [Candidatus Pacearchaeota archaeon]